MIARIFLCLILSACTTIDRQTQPPTDFPKLTVKIKRVNYADMQEKCGIPLMASLFVQCFGITETDFCTKTCNITLHTGLFEEHEREHCRGFDHHGDSHMRDAWASYNQMDGPRFCHLKLGHKHYCSLWPEDLYHCTDPQAFR